MCKTEDIYSIQQRSCPQDRQLPTHYIRLFYLKRDDNVPLLTALSCIYLILKLQATGTTSSKRSSSGGSISRQTTPVQFAFVRTRSPLTKKQYQRRLKQFFDYLGLSGDTIEDQAQTFLARAKNESEYWVEDSILLYMNSQKDRVLITKEIAPGTLHNFYQPIKNFCKAHKLSNLLSSSIIDWENIENSLSQSKNWASDRSLR
jgi:hypothetical protein